MAVFVIIAVLGEDRPGLVELMSQAIAESGGNWLESRMARLAGKFAGILRASIPDAEAEALGVTLHELEAHGLRMMVEWSASDEPEPASNLIQLDLIGPDRPGIIREISHALAERGVNIDALHTDSVSAPMSGEPLFKATALIRTPADVAFNALQAQLDHLAHELMLDIDLEMVSATSQT